VNDAPAFNAGGNQIVLEDAGLVTVNPWATGISPGPANEAGQTLNFIIQSNTNPLLFSAGPAVSSGGVLTFTPAANAFGNATITLLLQDNGGLANGGVNTSGPQGFSITVTAVNDPPSVTPPAAYAAHAHIGINIPDGATDLFDGSTITDVDGPGAQPFSITATGPIASANGGSVTIAANGSFTYNPPVGFTGANDTFPYQICDSGVPGSACTNATATVAVSGPRVWFVNNGGAAGDGRLSSPFNTLAAADTAASANGDRIFAFTGASNYTGGFVLFTNQRLIGQGVVDTGFDAALGVTPPATSVARPAINGTRPTINGTVTVGANNTVRGLNIVTNGATGLTGNTFGTLTASEVSVTGDNGAAVSLITGNLAATFTSIFSTGGSIPGINLSGTTGTFTVTGNGGSCTSAATCTGGSIANKTGSSEATGTPGVRLFNVTNFRLTRMNISGNNHSGIYGGLVSNPSGAIDASTINGFQLDNCNITDNGDTGTSNPDETGVDLYNLVGTAIGGSNPTRITNTTISNNFEFELQITNSTATALTDLQMSGNTISSNTAAAGHGNLFNFLGAGGGSANMKLTLTSGTFTGNAPFTGTGVQCDHSGSGGTATCNLSGATFTNNNVAVSVSAAIGGSLAFNVSGNTATQNRSHGLNLFVAASTTGAVSGSFVNNIVGTQSVMGSGSQLGFGIRVQNEAVSTTNPATVLISGNTVQELGFPASGPNPATGFAAINVNQGIFGQTTSRPTNATITSNTVSNVYNSRAIIIQQNNSTNTTGSAGLTCADISGNNMSNIAGNIGDGTKIRFRQLAGGTFNVRQQTPTAAAIANELDDANGFNNPLLVSIGGFPTFNAGACPLP